MPHLPDLSWEQYVKLALRQGYKFKRFKGSHAIYRNDDIPSPHKVLVIPRNKNFHKGIRRALLRRLRLSLDDVRILLKEGKI